MMYRTHFDTPEQALVEALYLGLTAPSDGQAQEAGEVAESLAIGMDWDTVEKCKAAALERWEAMDE